MAKKKSTTVKSKKAGTKKAPHRKPALPAIKKAQAGKGKVVKRAAEKERKIPAKGALVAQIAGASRVLFTANGTGLLVVREEKKTLTLWDISSGMETPPLKALPTVSAVALSADNRFIAMGTSTGILAVDSAQAGKVAWKTKAGAPGIGKVLFTLDGALVIACGDAEDESDAWLRVYKTASGEEEKGFEPVAGAKVGHLALSPDGLFLAHSEMHSGSVLIWHLPTKQMGVCVRLNKSHGRITDIVFGRSVKELFVAQENRITAWNGENGVAVCDMGVEGVRSLAVLASGHTLMSLRSGEAGAALNLWNPETGRLRDTLALPGGEYGALATPPGGAYVALAAPGGCWVWKTEKMLG